MPNRSEPRKPIVRETLADQVASDITDQILSGSLTPGAALPTEPQLAETYGVGRSAVRDATRLLMARGLVKVRHGKGVFVTSSQQEPFADALILALRRDGATAWDVDEFMDRLVVMAVSLTTANASDEEIDEIERLSAAFVEALEASNDVKDQAAFEQVARAAEEAFDQLHEALFEATHNRVLQHVAQPLRALRRLREWDLSQISEDLEPAEIQDVDRRFIETLVECLRSRDPSRAATALDGIAQLPEEAIDALKRTPVGEVARIVLTSVKRDAKAEEAECE